MRVGIHCDFRAEVKRPFDDMSDSSLDEVALKQTACVYIVHATAMYGCCETFGCPPASKQASAVLRPPALLLVRDSSKQASNLDYNHALIHSHPLRSPYI
jgi:hypothetical protein